MPKFHYLGSQLEFAAGSGGQIDFAHRYLRRETQRIGCGGTVRNNGFSPLFAERLDGFRDFRGPGAEAALHRRNVQTTADAKKFATFRQPGKRLVDGGTIAQMEQLLCGDVLTLRQPGRDCLFDSHVRSISQIMT